MKNFVRWLCAVAFSRALAFRSRPYAFPSGTALVIAPHADDEVLGCGGLIAAKRERGHEVQVVFITDSAASHRDHHALTGEAVADMRRAEALQSLALLGVPATHVYFFDVPDGTLNKLTPTAQVGIVLRLATLIRDSGATEIFAPYRDGGSSEHTVAQQMTALAARSCGVGTLHEYPIWAWWNPFRLRSRLASNATNLRLELGPLRTLKHAALACHRSQMEPQPPATEPALPPILARLCCGPTEFFFQRST